MTDDKNIERVRIRMSECEVRRHASCGKIDRALGFDNAIEWATCDGCKALQTEDQGPDTPAAAAFRAEYCATVVRNVKANLDRAHPTVILTILGKHMEPGESGPALMRVAPRIGREKAVEIARRLGGEDLVATVHTAFSGLSEESQVAAMHPAARWEEIEGFWEQLDEESPDVECWSLRDKVSYWLAAEASGKGVPRDTLELRHISCHGTTIGGIVVKKPCPSRKEGPGGYFCGDCGCGFRKRARLDNKLHYRELRCPRRMPGFANAILTVRGEPHAEANQPTPRVAGSPAPA